VTGIDPVNFGSAVRRARVARDMTQEELGETADLGMKHVSEIERGTRDLRLSTISQLAKGLGMPGGQLLYLTEEEAAVELGAMPKRLARSTCGGRPALLVRPIEPTSRLLVLDLVHDSLARATARDYATRAQAGGDSQLGTELLATLAELEAPIVPTSGFVPNAKQRARLQAMDANGEAWRPANGGEARMADVLSRHGLLSGPHSPNRAYAITEAGRDAAREGHSA
jgi:transcriptional regulator with XRE-family HTH domain